MFISARTEVESFPFLIKELWKRFEPGHDLEHESGGNWRNSRAIHAAVLMASRSVHHPGVYAWNRSGFIKGAGIPVPSGPHNVGCVDVMHQFEGETLGVLVRLFYPTGAEPGTHQYANWLSHKRYIRGILDYIKVSAAGMLTTFSSKVFGKRGVGSVLSPVLMFPL